MKVNSYKLFVRYEWENYRVYIENDKIYEERTAKICQESEFIYQNLQDERLNAREESYYIVQMLNNGFKILLRNYSNDQNYSNGVVCKFSQLKGLIYCIHIRILQCIFGVTIFYLFSQITYLKKFLIIKMNFMS